MSAPLSVGGWLASLIAITLTGQCQSLTNEWSMSIAKRERGTTLHLAWICAKYNKDVPSCNCQCQCQSQREKVRESQKLAFQCSRVPFNFMLAVVQILHLFYVRVQHG